VVQTSLDPVELASEPNLRTDGRRFRFAPVRGLKKGLNDQVWFQAESGWYHGARVKPSSLFEWDEGFCVFAGC
jgi:hypothetical protein